MFRRLIVPIFIIVCMQCAPTIPRPESEPILHHYSRTGATPTQIAAMFSNTPLFSDYDIISVLTNDSAFIQTHKLPRNVLKALPKKYYPFDFQGVYFVLIDSVGTVSAIYINHSAGEMIDTCVVHILKDMAFKTISTYYKNYNEYSVVLATMVENGFLHFVAARMAGYTPDLWDIPPKPIHGKPEMDLIFQHVKDISNMKKSGYLITLCTVSPAGVLVNCTVFNAPNEEIETMLKNTLAGLKWQPALKNGKPFLGSVTQIINYQLE